LRLKKISKEILLGAKNVAINVRSAKIYGKFFIIWGWISCYFKAKMFLIDLDPNFIIDQQL